MTLQGDDNNCVNSWNDFGTTASSFGNCSEFDFVLQYNPSNYPPYNSAFINLTASNECGNVSQNIIVSPSYLACSESRYEIVISPNPASNMANTKLYLNRAGTKEQLNIDFLEIMDSQGNILKRINESGMDISIDLLGFRSGQYVVRTYKEEKAVIEQLIITK